MPDKQDSLMQLAIKEARAAAARGEVPVGAVVVDALGNILAIAGNMTEAAHDPTAHAEILALRAAAAKRLEPRLPDCDLYVTLEPCAMCAAAISFARIRRVYYGAYDPKGGAVDHGSKFFQSASCHHAPDVFGGIMERDNATILQDFFKARRT